MESFNRRLDFDKDRPDIKAKLEEKGLIENPKKLKILATCFPRSMSDHIELKEAA